MKNMKTTLVATKIFFLATLCACTSTQYVSLDASGKNSSIGFFLSKTQLPLIEYEAIAYIETSGSVFATHEQLVRSLKRKAAKLGGDAVIEANFFYIPWAFSSTPAINGVVVKYKKQASPSEI